MKNLAMFVFSFIASAVLFSGCTVYTEKQTESLSRAVYATKDSIDCGRFELADSYSSESTRLVRPPKNRIEITPIYKNNNKPRATNDVKSTEKNKDVRIPSLTDLPHSRTLVIPVRFGDDPVTVVGTEEYDKLLQDNRVAVQLKADLENLSKLKSEVDVELQKQFQMRDKMVEEIVQLQKKLVEKDLSLLRKNILIVSLVGAICVAAYLRLKGIL